MRYSETDDYTQLGVYCEHCDELISHGEQYAYLQYSDSGIAYYCDRCIDTNVDSGYCHLCQMAIGEYLDVHLWFRHHVVQYNYGNRMPLGNDTINNPDVYDIHLHDATGPRYGCYKCYHHSNTGLYFNEYHLCSTCVADYVPHTCYLNGCYHTNNSWTDMVTHLLYYHGVLVYAGSEPLTPAMMLQPSLEDDSSHQVLYDHVIDRLFIDDYDNDDYDDDDDDDDVLETHDYNYRPREWIHYGTGNLRYGVELELELSDYGYYTSTEVKDPLVDWAVDNKLFFKHDGSLDDGVEVVTHPCTLDYHINNFNWEGLCSSLGHVKAWDSTNCGMHIHASRDDMTKSHIAKVVKFIMDNSTEVKRFAGRGSTEYAQYPGDCLRHFKKLKDADYDLTRYVMLNLNNKHTIEFRMFRGTKNPQRILCNIEFVDAIIHYAKQLSYSDIAYNKHTWQAFIKWSKDNNYSENLVSRLTKI